MLTINKTLGYLQFVIQNSDNSEEAEKQLTKLGNFVGKTPFGH